jgi:nitroreductase/dihydropteridine reductase
MVVLKMRNPKQGQRDTRKGYVEFYRNEQKTLCLDGKSNLSCFGQLLFAAG